MTLRPRPALGFTLVELLAGIVIAAGLMLAMITATQQAMQSMQTHGEVNAAQREGAEAMRRMAAAVRTSRALILPMPDNPNTDWREDRREQTIPASPPEGSSNFASAVLSVTLTPLQDNNMDGWADANNDADYQDLNGNGSRDAGEPERIDEDPPADRNTDGEPGIAGLDDNGNGAIDDGDVADDDEDGSKDEDPLNSIDDDSDGNVDEDTPDDLNNDGESGVAGVDDDNDGVVDEDYTKDDDEDGLDEEDWLDTVSYYLVGPNLIERRPVFLDINMDGKLNGEDYFESVIATGVTLFRVEYIAAPRASLVDLRLQLERGATTTTLSTRVRLGGGL